MAHCKRSRYVVRFVRNDPFIKVLSVNKVALPKSHK